MKNIDRNQASDEALYNNEFIVTIIEVLWAQHQACIFLVFFVPFLIYALLCIVYLPKLLTKYEDDESKK